MPSPRASQALTRFTVLDLTRVRAGPTCVRQLADWGANVIKIETPPHLEKGEGPGGPRENADFQNLHRNKRSMTLDLKSPQGIAAFRRMVEKADVVVENFRPDVKNRLGIDYESLKKINKRIVLGSISGFGQDGPYANRPGFDQIAQGMGGLMSITGLPDGAYTLSVRAIDQAGSIGPAGTAAYVLDTTPPAAPTYTLIAGSPTETPRISRSRVMCGEPMPIAKIGISLSTALAALSDWPVSAPSDSNTMPATRWP